MGWDDLTITQKRELATLLAEERLPVINEKLSAIQPSRSFYARYINV